MIRAACPDLRREIVDQVVRANRVIADGGLGGKRPGDLSQERVSNIVFMGMGEPLANYARVIRAVRTLVAAQPEASVALYSLGSPDLLAAATSEIVDRMAEWGLIWAEAAVKLRTRMSRSTTRSGILVAEKKF